MRTKLVIALCLAAAGTATAQPTDPPPTGDPSNPNPNTDPQPPPPQPPPPQPPPPKPQPPPPPAPAPETHRPDGLAVAIGLGYQFIPVQPEREGGRFTAASTSLETPNIATVRLRLNTGLTFEPLLSLQGFKHTTDTGEPIDDKVTFLQLGAIVRSTVASHGRVDLDLVGAFNLSNKNENPDGDDDETSTTQTQLLYGFAIGTWITRHWQVSMTATNPLLSFVKVRQEMGPMNVLVTSDTTFGLVFNPTVLLMVHLYN